NDEPGSRGPVSPRAGECEADSAIARSARLALARAARADDRRRDAAAAAQAAVRAGARVVEARNSLGQRRRLAENESDPRAGIGAVHGGADAGFGAATEVRSAFREVARGIRQSGADGLFLRGVGGARQIDDLVRQ